jgi:hypothetical protein
VRILGSVLHVRTGALAALLAWSVLPLAAQDLPSGPLVLANGRVAVSGDVSLTTSCSSSADDTGCSGDTGFFNYSDYENSTLRMARFGVSTSVQIASRLTGLAEIRFENGEAPRPYGLYLRVEPFAHHDFDIQAGRIPSTFGSFARRAYSTDNPLIGYPLAYQYLTSLRSDAVPDTPDDLLRMRARGWLSSFSLGDPTPAAGLPLAEAFRWDTGVQAHGTVGWFEAAVSVSNGSLSNPLFSDHNDGKQFAGRIVARPVAGLVIGASASRAPFVSSSAAAAAHARAADFVQRVLGADVEYSRGHYLVRMETVASTYTLPTIQPHLHATGTLVEGRYKLTPRVHLAARVDHLGFSTIAGSVRTINWDAPVTRWELGGGYALQRNVQLRLSLQHNARDGGRVRSMTALAAQFLYWF